MGMGGTTPRVKLKYAMREFKINPIKACINFYALTGLNVSEALIESLHLDHLSWGLDQLETNIITSPVPLNYNVYVGKLDPLSDTVLLKNNIPQLRCIDEATHDPTLLIKAIEGNSMSHIVDSFSRAASGYRNYAHIQRSASEKLAAFIPINRNLRALEMGAGSGLFTQHLIPWEGQFLATDASPQMCKEGKKNIDSVEWKQMDLLRPSEENWDYIFSSSVLQWVDDPRAVFHAWSKVLAPKAKIICSIFVEGSLMEWLHVSSGVSPVIWRTQQAWEDSLYSAGFEHLRQESETISHFYPCALDWLKAMRGMGTTPFRLISPAKLRASLKLYDKLFTGDQGVCCTWVVYRFEAALK
jgi:malonyl-CoA O-methyltransferase